MKGVSKKVWYVLSLVILVPILFLAVLSLLSKKPQLGLVDGMLRSCLASPNCVCSEQGETNHRIAPLRFEDSPEKAWERAKEAVIRLGGHIQQEREDYLHATFVSRLFRFEDDLELRLAAEDGLIHIRSAARVGYSDLGVNRKRVEKLRRLFNKTV